MGLKTVLAGAQKRKKFKEAPSMIISICMTFIKFGT